MVTKTMFGVLASAGAVFIYGWLVGSASPETLASLAMLPMFAMATSRVDDWKPQTDTASNGGSGGGNSNNGNGRGHTDPPPDPEHHKAQIKAQRDALRERSRLDRDILKEKRRVEKEAIKEEKRHERERRKWRRMPLSSLRYSSPV